LLGEQESDLDRRRHRLVGGGLGRWNKTPTS
jgi:hypothetical protein